MNYKLFLAVVCFMMAISLCCCSKDDFISCKRYDIPREIELETPDNQILVINSEADFERYFGKVNAKLPKDKPLAKIAFNRFTLVYVQGMVGSGISECKSSLDTNFTPYILSVNIKQNYTDVITRWNVAYLIDKQEHPNIKLQLNIEKDD